MNESSLTPKALTETAKLTALTILLAVFALLLPFFWFISLAVVPLPVVVITLKRGIKYGLLASVASGILVTLLIGPAEGIPIFLIITLLGVAQGVAIKNDLNPSKVLIIGTIAVALALVLMGFLLYWLQGINIIAEQAKMADKVIEVQKTLYIQSGISKAEAQRQLKPMKEVFAFASWLLPGGIMVFSLWVSALAEILSSTILRRLRLKFLEFPPFKIWQLPWWFAWGFIFGLAGALFYQQLRGLSQVILIISMNLLFIFTVLFLIQGLSITAFFLDKYRATIGVKILVFTLAVFLQLILQGLTWLGLLDTWFNFRKLPQTS